MKKMIFYCNRLYFTWFLFVVSFAASGQATGNLRWQAGVARVVITPEQSMWMVYGLPSTWSSNIETIILYEMVHLATEAGVPQID
jgi:hypothetical protein